MIVALTVAKRMKRSSSANFRKTIAFMIWRAMKNSTKVPLSAYVAISMMADLSPCGTTACEAMIEMIVRQVLWQLTWLGSENLWKSNSQATLAGRACMTGSNREQGTAAVEFLERSKRMICHACQIDVILSSGQVTESQ